MVATRNDEVLTRGFCIAFFSELVPLCAVQTETVEGMIPLVESGVKLESRNNCETF